MNKTGEFGVFRFVSVLTFGLLLALRSNNLFESIMTIASVFIILLFCIPIANLIPRKHPVAHLIGVIIAVRFITLALGYLPEFIRVPQAFVEAFGISKGAYLLLLSPMISTYVLYGRGNRSFGLLSYATFLVMMLFLGALRHAWTYESFLGMTLLRMPQIYILMHPAGILMILSAVTAAVVFIYRRKGHWTFKMVPHSHSESTVYSRFSPVDNESSLIGGMLLFSFWTGFLAGASTILLSVFSTLKLPSSIMSLAVVVPTVLVFFYSEYTKAGRLVFSDPLLNLIILPAHVFLVVLPSEMISVVLGERVFSLSNVLLVAVEFIFAVFLMLLVLVLIRVAARKALFTKPFNCISGGAMSFALLSMLAVLGQIFVLLGQRAVELCRTIL